MAKKEMKVQEITELLKDEIEPKLEKLRTEKESLPGFPANAERPGTFDEGGCGSRLH